MVVFNVVAFEAEVEVLGKLTKVGFQNGNLHIAGLSVKEAKLVLSRLSVGLQVETFDGNVMHGYQPKEFSPEMVVQAEASADQLNELVDQGRQHAVADQSAADALSGDLGQNGKEPSKGLSERLEPEDTSFKSAQDEANVSSKKGLESSQLDGSNTVKNSADKCADGELLEKIVKFTKLVDVISVMREEGGFVDDDALIAECERIKNQVPTLKRISDVSLRVKRVLERLNA